MTKNVSEKLIASHLIEGEMIPGQEIGLKIDQTLTQDATGTIVMLELEAMGLKKAKTELSAQYVDHNLLQTDFKNADDHLFLRSACQKFGIWYSRAGNGVSHPVHMECFGIPGKTLLGSDSHTPAAGSLGMLAFGAGGIEVALAIAGDPLYIKMPKIWNIRLEGKLPDFVSAKDVVLELLRRHTVKGAVGWILEYTGPGLKELTAMDRHVIANMGTELGATTSVFPSDGEVKKFLKAFGREKDFIEILADKGAKYDAEELIDLSKIEPMIALPSSPDKVVPVKEVAGRPIAQAMLGSSANPGFKDFAIPAEMLKGKVIDDRVSFDVNPTSRQSLENLTLSGHLEKLIKSGARVHQAGCNGCIGMGQAPATGRISLRTIPRNFPGRSGTMEDEVYLCSPETATASAITGVITDPRTLKIKYPKVTEPSKMQLNTSMLLAPLKNGEGVKLEKGPNIKPLPKFAPPSTPIEGPVLIKVGDNMSTDGIMPAGEKVLPFRSNIPEISKFVFSQVDDTYYHRALRHQKGGHIIVGGLNYGQGSSREHAAIAPRYLGVKVVIAKSFARIHWQNLVNFGILPLTFDLRHDYKDIDVDDHLVIHDLKKGLKNGHFEVFNKTKKKTFKASHSLSERQITIFLKGGITNYFKKG